MLLLVYFDKVASGTLNAKIFIFNNFKFNNW